MPNTVRVFPGRESLQREIELADPFTTLVLEPGEYGPITLPGRPLNLTIECDGFDQRFRGKGRISADANLPVIASDSHNAWPVVSGFGTEGVVFRGIDIRNTRKDDSSNRTICVCLGKSHDLQDATALDQLPNSIHLDKCRIGGTPGRENTFIGILGNARTLTVSDSIINHVVQGGLETQGVIVTNTPGPVVLSGNEIVASSENVMVGGSSPTIPGLAVCEDGIELEGNHIHKPTSWRMRPELNCKNLLELKNCHHCEVLHNLFENNWLDNQNGIAILLTPREHNPADYGKPPRPAVRTRVGHFQFRHNVVRNVDGFINIAGSDSNGNVMATGTIEITHNSVFNVGNPLLGRIFQIASSDPTKPIGRLDIHHNVLLHGPNAHSLFMFEGVSPGIHSLRFAFNSFTAGRYGVMAPGSADFERNLAEWCNSVSWRDNRCLDRPGEFRHFHKGERSHVPA